MKSIFGTMLLASALTLGLGGATSMLVGCDSDDAVDSNGKAISDLDIGGDLTLDKGATQQMTATVVYADGTRSAVTESDDLVWNIGNTDVATINDDGVVTGVNVGATQIKATYQGKESASRALIVK